jgi:hypothetical protein
MSAPAYGRLPMMIGVGNASKCWLRRIRCPSGDNK